MYHMQMTTDPEVRTTTVTRRDGEPRRIKVKTAYRSGEFQHITTYTFNVHGSTAELVSITPDNDSFSVQSNAETARLARDAVQALPFVQATVMFPALDADDDN